MDINKKIMSAELKIVAPILKDTCSRATAFSNVSKYFPDRFHPSFSFAADLPVLDLSAKCNMCTRRNVQ